LECSVSSFSKSVHSYFILHVLTSLVSCINYWTSLYTVWQILLVIEPFQLFK